MIEKGLDTIVNLIPKQLRTSVALRTVPKAKIGRVIIITILMKIPFSQYYFRDKSGRTD